MPLDARGIFLPSRRFEQFAGTSASKDRKPAQRLLRQLSTKGLILSRVRALRKRVLCATLAPLSKRLGDAPRSRDTFRSREIMIYVKSFLTGLGALIAYGFLYVKFGVGVRLFLPTPTPPEGHAPEGVSYVSNSPWAPVPIWGPLTIGLFLFAVGYFWMFRRLRRART
jgi:hypothetical protein